LITTEQRLESIALVAPKAIFAFDETVRGETARPTGLDVGTSVPIVIADEDRADEIRIEDEGKRRPDDEPSVNEGGVRPPEVIEKAERIAAEADGLPCGSRSRRYRRTSHGWVRFAC
jgi:hypothetical protein